MIASFDVFALPDTDADEILTLLKRCDKFVCHGDAPPLCELRFDVLADILAELLQIGGGFEWSKSKYSSTPAWRPDAGACVAGVVVASVAPAAVVANGVTTPGVIANGIGIGDGIGVDVALMAVADNGGAIMLVICVAELL